MHAAAAQSRVTPDVHPVAANSGFVASRGFVLYFLSVFSGFANDWSLRIFGTKAYLSTVMLFLLPLAWIASGNALRGFRTGIGFWWAAFLAWMLLATPFSVWRGGSATMLANYVPRAYLNFFYTCAFVTSVRKCRQWMYVQIAGAFLLIATCFAFGSAGAEADDARFRIAESLFYANSNDLGFGLLVAITSLLFLLHRRGRIARPVGALGTVAASLYLFRTGSRGCVIAGVAVVGLIVWLSRSKWKTACITLASIGGLVALSIAGSTSVMFHRLSFLTGDASSTVRSESDLAAVASQSQRKELFKTSLQYTVRHPLFGVGPDQFAAAISQDAARTNEQRAWLGTHNTYTQVSSECGIPGLLLYAVVIVLSLRANFRLYRQTRDREDVRELAGISFSLLSGILVFAVSALFFHMAYSAYLPSLAGFTAALQFAGRHMPRPSRY